MNRCTRYEEEALLLLEQGKPLPAHFTECPDCLEQAEEYRHVKQRLANLHEDEGPRLGWEARALRRVAPAPPAPAWWQRLAVPLATAASLAVVAYVVMELIPPAPPAPPVAQEAGLTATVRPGSSLVMRGTSAHPGDILALEADTGGHAHAELRVYLNDREVVLSCGADPACETVDGTIRAELTMTASGMYQPVLFLSSDPIGPAGTSLDADTARVQQQGGEVLLDQPVDVR